MDYDFKVGDILINIYGRSGKIVRICDCDKCKERGFKELIVKWDDSGEECCINNYQAEFNFPDFYRVSDLFFPYHVDINDLLEAIEVNITEIKHLRNTNKRLNDFISEVKAFKQLQKIMDDA